MIHLINMTPHFYLDAHYTILFTSSIRANTSILPSNPHPQRYCALSCQLPQMGHWISVARKSDPRPCMSVRLVLSSLGMTFVCVTKTASGQEQSPLVKVLHQMLSSYTYFSTHAVYVSQENLLYKWPDRHTLLSSFTAVVYCPLIIPPTNGSVVSSGTILGSSVKYQCDAGFKLNGPSIRICQTNGSWTDSEPTCECELTSAQQLKQASKKENK